MNEEVTGAQFNRRVMDRRINQHQECCIDRDAILKVIEYVELQKAKETRRNNMITNITQNVIGWGLILIIGYTGRAVYQLFVNGVKN